MRKKITTISLIWIVGLVVLKVGTCGHNRFSDFSSLSRHQLASQAQPVEIKGKVASRLG